VPQLHRIECHRRTLWIATWIEGPIDLAYSIETDAHLLQGQLGLTRCEPMRAIPAAQRADLIIDTLKAQMARLPIPRWCATTDQHIGVIETS
jgi:hypothetical protein